MPQQSQNGWTANNRSLIESRSVPGGKLAVRKGAAGDLLIWIAHRFHNEVEALRWPGNWGYAERAIRGSSTTLSNHASGTAIDLNAPAHPLGTSPGANFSRGQIARIREILRACDGTVRWGGDYSGRKDPMHFEINANLAKIEAVWAKLNKPIPAPPPSPDTKIERVLKLTDPHMQGEDVRALQSLLNRAYPAYSDLDVDGDFGPSTEAVVKEFQRRASLAVDGAVGPQTRRALGL